jgi:hypothetical protein
MLKTSIAKFDVRGIFRKFVAENSEGFVIKKVFPSKDYNLVLYDFEHTLTKARYIHLA